jgi:hypothetical protein
MVRLRAQFDGKVLVPLGPVDLPRDRVLDVEIHDAPENPAPSAALLLKLMHEPPHLTRDDVQALEQAIEQGKIPPQQMGAFDDLADT